MKKSIKIQINDNYNDYIDGFNCQYNLSDTFPFFINNNKLSTLNSLLQIYGLEMGVNKTFTIDLIIPKIDLKRHPIINLEKGIANKIIRMYCTILNRDCIDYYDISKNKNIDKINIDSATIFLPLTLINSDDIVKIKTLLNNYTKFSYYISFIKTDSLENICWILLKILLGKCTKKSIGIIDEEMNKTEKSILEVNQTYFESLYFNGHSRPHCGIIRKENKKIGICGSKTSANKGLCFNNMICNFSSDEKIITQHLKTSKLFYNGCFGAQFSTPTDGFDQESLLIHSFLKGDYISEYISNYSAGMYNEWDIKWFKALSYLQFKPAQVVQIINDIRKIHNREYNDSLLYFGDALNDPWKTNDVAYINQSSPKSGFKLKKGTKLVIVELDNEINLIKKSRFSVLVKNAHIELKSNFAEVYYPTDRKALLLIEIEKLHFECNFDYKIIYTIKYLTQNYIRKIHSYFTQFDMYSRITIDVRLNEIKSKLLLYIKNIFKIYNKNFEVYVFKQGNDLLNTIDNYLKYINIFLLNNYVETASQHIYWEDSYINEGIIVPFSYDRECFICKNKVKAFKFKHYLHKTNERIQAICPECGLICDLPNYLEKIYIDYFYSEIKNEILNVKVKISNKSKSAMMFYARIQVQGLIHEMSNNNYLEIKLKANQIVEHSFYAALERNDNGFNWIRLHCVADGHYGFFSKPFLIY